MVETNDQQKPVFIYLHGFNSSPQSQKARVMQHWFAEHPDAGELWVPDLSSWPHDAVEQVATRIKTLDPNRPLLLVGSSLGGYYATALVERFSGERPQLRAVLVNPAVHPYRLLAAWLGENQNYHTADRYELTHEHLHQLERLDCLSLRYPARFLVLLQSGDETLNYREAVEKYAASARLVEEGGCHGFAGFDRLLPAIIEFAHGRLQLPEPRELPLGEDTVE